MIKSTTNHIKSSTYKTIDNIVKNYDSWSGSDMEPACKNCAKELKNAGFDKSDVQEFFYKDGIYNEETGEGTWDKDYVECVLKNINSSAYDFTGERSTILPEENAIAWNEDHSRGIWKYGDTWKLGLFRGGNHIEQEATTDETVKDRWVEKYNMIESSWKKFLPKGMDLLEKRNYFKEQYSMPHWEFLNYTMPCDPEWTEDMNNGDWSPESEILDGIMFDSWKDVEDFLFECAKLNLPGAKEKLRRVRQITQTSIESSRINSASRMSANEHEANEVALHAMNDIDLQPKIKSVIDNLKRKIKNGSYNQELAYKLWQYVIDEEARKVKAKWGGVYSPATRYEAAKQLAEHYDEDLYED